MAMALRVSILFSYSLCSFCKSRFNEWSEEEGHLEGCGHDSPDPLWFVMHQILLAGQRAVGPRKSLYKMEPLFPTPTQAATAESPSTPS